MIRRVFYNRFFSMIVAVPMMAGVFYDGWCALCSVVLPVKGVVSYDGGVSCDGRCSLCWAVSPIKGICL